MIIDSDLNVKKEGHPLKNLNSGEISGSFFKRLDNNVLPEGLYEISDSHDFANGIIEDGYEWSFDSDLCEPVAMESEVIELTTQQRIDALEATQTARMLRQAALGDEYSINMLQSIEDEITTLRESL